MNDAAVGKLESSLEELFGNARIKLNAGKQRDFTHRCASFCVYSSQEKPTKLVLTRKTAALSQDAGELVLWHLCCTC